MQRIAPLRSTTRSLRRRRNHWPLRPTNSQLALETLKRSIAGDDNPKHGFLSVLIDSYKTHHCPPNPIAYSLTIQSLARRSLFHHLEPVLDHLESSERFEIDECAFVELILRYGKAGMHKEAVDVFLRMPRFRCAPTSASLDALLRVLCVSAEGLALVGDVLVNASDMRVRLAGSSFGILIRALCRAGKVRAAIELLGQMEVHECAPDAGTYSSILHSLCEHSDSASVVGFLEQMRGAGVTPNGGEYARVVRVLARERKAREAYAMLCQMRRDGARPNIAVYNVVLDGFASVGDSRKVNEVFDEILVMGLAPDAFTYNAYINGLCKKGDIDGARNMLACMEKAGCEADVVTYNTIVAACGEAGDMGRAREVICEMRAKGLVEDAQTYAIVIEGLVAKGEVREACEVLEEMRRRGWDPPVLILDAVICGLCERGMALEAVRVLGEVVGRSVSPGARSWMALLGVCGVVFEKALMGLEDVIKLDQMLP
ncbi:Pentatricopeptide repeat-containing protein [Acorus gramineus]|uniref:Pentatricopeptide repeat-containing protein n=1 Tax=Acorus gramineus TaxID=55184 RepID=A0AAV9ALF3_ACOGR|nr:Pentatricopeptide repeat-containing protein [Acorus gramineus]